MHPILPLRGAPRAAPISAPSGFLQPRGRCSLGAAGSSLGFCSSFAGACVPGLVRARSVRSAVVDVENLCEPSSSGWDQISAAATHSSSRLN